MVTLYKDLYIVEGGDNIEIGNCMAYYGHALHAGQYAVCDEGEYANGGYGHYQVIAKRFASIDDAKQAIDDLTAVKKH